MWPMADGWVADSAGPNHMLHSVATDVGLHSLLRSVCTSTLGKYMVIVIPSQLPYTIPAPDKPVFI